MLTLDKIGKMRVYWLILLLLYTLPLAAQTNDCGVNIDGLLENKGAMLSDEAIIAIRPCVFQVQNQGFRYAEGSCKYDSAKLFINKALKAWGKMHDTLSEANLLKYLGYLNGQLRQFPEAKSCIHEAITLYGIKGASYGIAVSNFDLSKVYEAEGKLDSALSKCQEALSYWTGQDSMRVFGLNNAMIHLLSLSERKKEASAFITRNETIMTDNQLFWQSILDFYYVAAEYYMAIKDNANQQKYLKNYDLKRTSLNNGKYALYDPRHCQ